MVRHIEEMRPMPVPISIFSRSSISGVNTTYRNTANTHNDIVTDRPQINHFALFRVIIYSSFVKSIHLSLQALLTALKHCEQGSFHYSLRMISSSRVAIL